MGSSSSAPVRKILPAEEAIDNVDNEKQTGTDTLNVPELESNYPEVKPPVETNQSRTRSKGNTTRTVFTDLSSGRQIVLKNPVEVADKQENESVAKDNRIPIVVHTNNSKLNLKPHSAPNERPGTPARIQTVRAKQGYPLSAWPPPNMLKKGLTTMSVIHDSGTSLRGSFVSSVVFSELQKKFDEQSRLTITKREVMLFEREKCEYQQVILQENLSAIPEISPRVQMPQNLTKAWQALKTPDHGAHSSLKENDYTEADRKATEHKAHKADTYSSLVKDLTSSLPNDAMKVWAILSWISKQGIGRISFGKKVINPDSPNGYMQMVQENKGTYPVFFALLCRSACIPCAVVPGLSKSSDYEVGSENIDELQNTWNAVFVDGSWRLVHPLWVCRSLRGHQQGGWLTIEKDGQASNQISREEKGSEVATYNSYYIFTEPEEFIYRNFPDDQQWQLLKEPWSKEDFINSAYLRPEFFKRKFKLLGENKCVLVSNDAQPSYINIGFSTENGKDLVFTYDLSIRVEEMPILSEEKQDEHLDINSNMILLSNENDTNGDTFITENRNIENGHKGRQSTELKTVIENSNAANFEKSETPANLIETTNELSNLDNRKDSKLKRFVAIFKEHDSVVFEIRFPKKGSYKLRIYGGLFSVNGYEPPCIMEVRLECLADVVQPKPLPFDPGIAGWGHGPIAESLGLYVPSHDNGIIDITKDEETVLQFILKKTIQIKVDMFHTETTETSLSKFVHHKIVELKETYELRIIILCPGKGEFAVKIDALKKETNLFENACNYLVHTRKERPHEDFYTRKSRKMLLEAMLDLDVDALEMAVESCKQCGMPEDDPEYRGGRNRLEFLQCRKALRDCLLINRIDVIEQALCRASKARFYSLMPRDIKKAERHLDEIRELNKGGWNSHIPEIDRQSLFEMCRLRKPKDEIYHTMKAVYMLLGVDKSEVKAWSQIQLLMRKGEATIVEMARLEKYLDVDQVEILSPDTEALENIQEVLSTYSEEDVRKIDNTAAAFYQWVVAVLSKLKESHKRKKMKEEHNAGRGESSRHPSSVKKGSNVSKTR